MVNIKFDSEKALEAILYVASKAPIPDIYHVIKILYFADLKHLERYGRLVTGDTYIAMKDGPVASGAYDIIKLAKKTSYAVPADLDVGNVLKSLDVEGVNVKPLRPYEDDVFSDSDLECINEAISEIGHLSFGKIRCKSHGFAWKSADENGEMTILSLAKECSDGCKDLLDYLSVGA
ncbi:Panacea domain-containing protein [Providencia stuartii]|uniref:Panacea domain-containing protein n=1 Tax=Providencia stuartii TaxID=588 RepID=UPI0034E3B29D